MTSHYELYRNSTLGVSLTDALDEMIQNEMIPADLALKVLLQFDKSINEALATSVKTKATLKGHLNTYRGCDNVWTFILQNCTFRCEGETVNVDWVKIVACDGKVLRAAENE
eukprot:GCRY01001553.1.p1 GENE.GCRY01001553.1~~GCRY01001553.1.p1  ORF type:complete len:112 (+),score=8.15 GCRY01001553.1:152-487(+)